MLFCGTELAARIERAERGLIEDCTAAVERADALVSAFATPPLASNGFAMRTVTDTSRAAASRG
jgi:hypothetical protein